MQARVPRRPEVPGVPGVPLPKPDLPAEDQPLPESQIRTAVREVSKLAPVRDEDEPTNPRQTLAQARREVDRGSVQSRNLSREEARQLGEILAVWDVAASSQRSALLDFALRLGSRR